MTGRAASLAVLLLLGACASAPRAPEAPPAAAPAAKSESGGCRPFFVDPGVFSDAPPPNHSCWNLAWEVPVTLVVVPLAIGVFTAPVWVPILLLR